VGKIEAAEKKRKKNKSREYGELAKVKKEIEDQFEDVRLDGLFELKKEKNEEDQE